MPLSGTTSADGPDSPVVGESGATSRNGYVDLLRTVSMVAVILGHWLATGVRRQGGHVVGIDALSVVTWGGWVTLLLQVVPLFFLVGGYANAVSWQRHDADGMIWSSWVRDRALRLLVPTCGYAGAIAVVVVVGQLVDGDPRTLAQAGWALSLHLWFLAAYLVILLFTPVLYAAHRRWGLRVPVTMALVAVVIDTGVVDASWHVVGWANYLLVWGTFHQLGFSWHDRSLTGRRAGRVAVAAIVALVGLIWWGPYPVSMVGTPGAHIQNASPPSSALLAFGLAQAGVAIACEPLVTRVLRRHRRARLTVDRLAPFTMPVYLWHMVPVVVVIEAGYLRVVGQPAVGSGEWWQQRPIWIVVLGVVLALLLAVLAALARLFRRPIPAVAAVTRPSRAAVPRLLLSVILAAVGIGYLSIHGFARGGRLDPLPLVMLATATLLIGWWGARQPAPVGLTRDGGPARRG